MKICSRGNKECLGKNIYIFVVFFFFLMMFACGLINRIGFMGAGL